jgi:hypothetical protein
MTIFDSGREDLSTCNKQRYTASENIRQIDCQPGMLLEQGFYLNVLQLVHQLKIFQHLAKHHCAMDVVSVALGHAYWQHMLQVAQLLARYHAQYKGKAYHVGHSAKVYPLL